MYQIYTNYPETVTKIADNGDVSAIPATPGNRHYQEYLEWLAEGNEPEVIDD